MGWVLRLVEIGVEGSGRSVDVMEISRPSDLGDIAYLGLTLLQGKQLVALVQQEIVTVQSRDHALRRPLCRSCGAACQSKDTAPTRSPPSSVRSCSGCPASAVPAAAGRRLVSTGHHIAARAIG